MTGGTSKLRRPSTALAVSCSAALLVACVGAQPHRADEQSAIVSSDTLAGTLSDPMVGQGLSSSPTLEAGEPREGDDVVAEGGAGAPYNYTPTLMREGEDNRMWWCSQYETSSPAGDDILYAVDDGEMERFAGPDGGIPQAVFSGSGDGFDGVHTCDPSVVKVDDMYYLYYTGADHAGDYANSIGLATSDDGITWTREHGGEPIVDPAMDTQRSNTYGAGQPTVTYVDGWFYLMFTDTTGQGAGWNGAGQFLLRSPDPEFTTEVEALGPEGFEAVEGTSGEREHSVLDAFSTDLMWVDVLDAFAVAHQTSDGTTVSFFNRDFSAKPYAPELIEGPWKEGPGLVRTPHGHAPLAEDDPCGTVPLDVVRATSNAEAPTDLRHFGVDVAGGHGCTETSEALQILDGYAMPSPERTMDVVADGELVRVERRSVAEQLADRVLDERPDHLADLPVAGRLASGADVLHSPSEGSGILLDGGRLARVDAERLPGIAERNDSDATTLSDERWSSYPEGPGFD